MFKTALGYFFLQLAVVGLVTNILVLVTLIRLIQKSDKNSIHLVSVFVVINDIISFLFDLCYFSPSVISSNYLVSDRLDSPLIKLIASFDLFTWHITNFLLFLMAFNRLTFVVFNKENLFTKTKVYVYVFISSILSIGKILLDVLVFPCCLYILDYQRFGYSLLKPEAHLKKYDTIYSALQASFFAIIITCYLVIFLSIHKSHQSVEQSADSKFHQKIRARERSYSVQFAYISLFFMISYSSFRLLPFVFGENCTDCHVIVPVFYAIGCTANACVYISLAQEVRHELFKKIFKNNSVESNYEGGVPPGLHPEQLQNIF